MLTDGDYTIRFIPLPDHVKALTVFDADCFANIYVNDRLSETEINAAVMHEIAHILRDDAYNSLGIHAVEGYIP